MLTRAPRYLYPSRDHERAVACTSTTVLQNARAQALGGSGDVLREEMVVSAPAAGQPPRAIRRSVPAHGGSASADYWAGRRHARDVGSACVRLQPARRASGGHSLIGTAEKAGADRPGMTAGESDGGARRRGSPAWSCLDGPHQTEPGVRLSCGWNIEVDAGDYPGDDPQNGQ